MIANTSDVPHERLQCEKLQHREKL